MKDLAKHIPNTNQTLFEKVYLSCYYGYIYPSLASLTIIRAKIGVLGLNGAGKSSLMKIIAGVDDEFEGELEFPGDPRVGYLEQVCLFSW